MTLNVGEKGVSRQSEIRKITELKEDTISIFHLNWNNDSATRLL
jgi:hypothetical protein